MTWMPIDTAPSDGSEFLVARRTLDDPGFSMSVACRTFRKKEPWFAELVPFSDEDFYATFTHWCELPAPPILY